MIYINNAILNQKPNVFVGGVSNTIPTKTMMANVLGVDARIIRNYRKVGDDVEFHILNNYDIKSYAFHGNIHITYYRDEGRRLKEIGGGAFMNATNLEEVRGLGIESVGGTGVNSDGTFRGCIILKRFITSEKWTTVNGRYEFHGCTLLEEVDISYIVSVLEYASMFYGCRNLPPITFNANYTGALGHSMFRGAVLQEINLNIVSHTNEQSFRSSTLLFNTLYSDYILNIGHHTFQNLSVNSTIETIEFPNCTSIGENAFYIVNATSLKNIILPKVTTFSGTAHFRRFLGDLIDLRGAKDFGTSTNSFNELNTNGVIIKLHEDIDPQDDNVTYALSRNAIIKLYDDNGNYVSDL